MSDAAKAVFLSYASQDAKAAKRIADALRAAGVEVWFDQSELVGGDAWDQKIRRQIKDCALLIPIISANTQARTEGYFRLEWRLADQRTHLMARGRPFLLPVVIDDTRDADAHVPDSFTDVQWTKAVDGEVSPAFVARVQKLLGGAVGGASRPDSSEPSGHEAPPTIKPSRPWLISALLGLVAVAVVAVWLVRKTGSSPGRSTPDARFQTPDPKPMDPAHPALRTDPQFAGPADTAIVPLSKPEDRDQQPEVGAAIDQKSVAVLAFANLSDDKANEYFSDGISEELLNVLAKISGLKVTARTSAFYFKGKEVPIPEIAKQLGVAYVVEGSVRKSGDKVRITAQLIKAADGFHVWSDTFTRDTKDVFAVQDEIAGLIAQQLQLKLADVPARVQTVNPEAHQLYLQGRYFANQPSTANLAKAVDFLQRAVDQDPSFAPAWGALARNVALQAEYLETTPESLRESFARARRAADRAIALAPKMPDGYFARLEIQTAYDYDWAGARDSLDTALALAPADALLISNASQLATQFGQVPRSLELGRRAAELDPVNAEIRYWLGRTYLCAGLLAEGEAELRRAAELSPFLLSVHRQLAIALVLQNRAAEGIGEAQLEKDEWSRQAALAVACWAAKDVRAADAALARLIEVAAESAAYQVGEAYAFRGETDAAFQWLDRAYRNRDSGFGQLRADPLLKSLHEDPRWAPLLKQAGLADEQLK